MNYNFNHTTDYDGDEATTEVFIYKDKTGLTIESDIGTLSSSGFGLEIQECVIAVLPDKEAIKLRDALIAMYPIGA